MNFTTVETLLQSGMCSDYGGTSTNTFDYHLCTYMSLFPDYYIHGNNTIFIVNWAMKQPSVLFLYKYLVPWWLLVGCTGNTISALVMGSKGMRSLHVRFIDILLRIVYRLMGFLLAVNVSFTF